MSYVLDTCIITAYQKNNEKVQRKLEEKIFLGEEIFINALSYYEIKRGLLDAKATKKLEYFNELCKKFKVLLLDDLSFFNKASKIYVNLKSKGKPIGNDVDILIGAQALEQNMTVVTDNIKHFKRINGLIIENWLRE